MQLFATRADGSAAGAGTAASPCETLGYVVVLQAGSPPGCCYQGGTLSIITPDGVSHDVTPPGGIPLKCPGDPPIPSLGATYTVRPVDAIGGTLLAFATYGGGRAFVGTPTIPAPVAGSSTVNVVIPCPSPDGAPPCVAFACDPHEVGVGADTGRMGLCADDPSKIVYRPEGDRCAETDTDPCTTARCDGAGTCHPGQNACDDGDPCTDDTCCPDSTCPSLCPHKQICVCGNGKVDPGEECDLGVDRNGAPDSCCESCRLRDPSFVCRKASSDCERDATCQRSIDGSCPANDPAPSDKRCEDGDLCTVGDHCEAGACTARDTVCDVSNPILLRVPGDAFPRIVISCTGIPVPSLASFCEAETFLDSATGVLTTDIPRPSVVDHPSVHGNAATACTADASGRIAIARLKRRPLRGGTTSLRQKLNACGRKLYRQLHPGESMTAHVGAKLGGITTDDPHRHDASLQRVVNIARGSGK